MASGNPNLLGQIAIREGLVTSRQLEECVLQQARAGRPITLGELLVENRFLTREQLDELLYLQAAYFRRLSIDPRSGGLFGQVAVREGYLTAERLNECLREQEDLRAEGASPGLGELLLRKGYLTAEQLLDVLRRQGRRIAKCPGCGIYLDLTDLGEGASHACPGCNATVAKPTA